MVHNSTLAGRWEANLEKGIIQEKEFLTQNTSESLQITLKSTIDLVDYLLEKCGFCYVLTSKHFLESSDRVPVQTIICLPLHSSNSIDYYQCNHWLNHQKVEIAQFLQLDTDYAPVITISDLKNSMKENSQLSIRKEKILKLRNHIDEILEEGRWDMDDVFKNNDFSDNVTFDCVVYYLAGYLAWRLSKKSKCELCLSGIKTGGKEIDLPAAQLVNLKTLGLQINKNNLVIELKRNCQN
ncbi:uncharacterized protein LOC132925230 [Rhopalosiphum padi]|uniref:uncharacterized protein LOC132925230 n=1 Tax=Rhopalosiphum padi TaxID=40932 RepID=UPI00298E14C7|nr:uncharacterized protein LOC132925230 [Rhopalosiphum padi]